MVLHTKRRYLKLALPRVMNVEKEWPFEVSHGCCRSSKQPKGADFYFVRFLLQLINGGV